jgi:hypothetical protein
VSGWIARKDRLPPERGAYLVFDPYFPEPVRVANWGTSKGFDNGRDNAARKRGYGVTHWMPLPPPPGQQRVTR